MDDTAYEPEAGLTRKVLDRLLAPFPDDEVKYLPRSPRNGKALALSYVDSRCVMRRLDDAVGPANWEFDYEILDGKGMLVKGILTIFGVSKCDAGEASKEEEPLKSAVSDALKRAAVLFGVGRYLYNMPRTWAAYDEQRRQFTEQPRFSTQAKARALYLAGYRGDAAAAVANAPAQTREAPAREPDQRPPATAQRTPQHAPESSGDRAVAQNAPAPAQNAPAPAQLVCTAPDCGKAITKGAHDVSTRAFGQALCPGCQKVKAQEAQTEREVARESANEAAASVPQSEDPDIIYEEIAAPATAAPAHAENSGEETPDEKRARITAVSKLLSTCKDRAPITTRLGELCGQASFSPTSAPPRVVMDGEEVSLLTATQRLVAAQIQAG